MRSILQFRIQRNCESKEDEFQGVDHRTKDKWIRWEMRPGALSDGKISARYKEMPNVLQYNCLTTYAIWQSVGKLEEIMHKDVFWRGACAMFNVWQNS